MSPKISIVVPLFNEAEVFPQLIARLTRLLDTFQVPTDVVFVDDGSSDDTAKQMEIISLGDSRFTSVFLSRNFGHQSALSAGLRVATGTEAVFIIDGDLQDPPELLVDFYKYLQSGYDVVYAIRKKRKEGPIKRLTYRLYYRLQRRLVNVQIPVDSGDFSLISRRAVKILNSLPEDNQYIRGLRSWIGFRQVGVEYERAKRELGDSKYSLRLLLKLALNGIFNFSDLPIRLITGMGALVMAGSSIYLLSVLVKKYVYNIVPIGFTAVIASVILFGGLQLFCFGVLGEYVLRIFFQVKDRPRFIIRDLITDKQRLIDCSPDKRDMKIL